MNRIHYALILILISISSHSQIDIGIKGGLNLNFSKEANIIGDFNYSNNSENSLGFHFGVMAEFEIKKLGITLRPEILYTNIKYNYNDLITLDSQSLTIQKIDIPILLEIKLKGPLRLLIGPSLEFKLSTDFDINEFKEVNNDNFLLNAQIGLGLKFERFDIDFRWERGFSKAASNFVSDNGNVGINFDARPNQLILGIAYRFGI